VIVPCCGQVIRKEDLFTKGELSVTQVRSARPAGPSSHRKRRHASRLCGTQPEHRLALTWRQAITEKQVLQQMASRPHPYVVSLRHAFQTEESICLVMDLIGGGDLYQLLRACATFSHEHEYGP
jgi:serine/threonine protein kinase